MPTVKDFGGFKIRMYFHDHNPPHVHVDSAGRNALVSIMDGNVFAGEIDTKYRDEALGWIAENREVLMIKWHEFQS